RPPGACSISSSVVRRVATVMGLSLLAASGCTLPRNVEHTRPRFDSLVEIPAGRFRMGSAPSEPGRGADEVEHVVTIVRPFSLGRYEVTQDDWRATMGSRPSHFAACGPTCPVENVSFADVQRFLDAANARSDNRYT